METTYKQHLILIALKLDICSLLNFCLVNKRIKNAIYDNSQFWKNKLVSDYKFTFLHTLETDTPRIYYKLLYKYINLNNSNTIYKIIKYGYADLLKFVRLSSTYDNLDLEWSLFNACWGGHKNLVDLFIQEQAEENGIVDWNYGLEAAARGGHIEIINYLIENGADAWDYAMAGAAIGGYLDIVKYFVDLGANKWNEGILSASGSRSSCALAIVKYFVKKGVKSLYLWDDCLWHARKNENLQLIEYLLKQKSKENTTKA